MSTNEPTIPEDKPAETKPVTAKAAETRLADVKKLTEAARGRGRKTTETVAPEARVTTAPEAHVTTAPEARVTTAPEAPATVAPIGRATMEKMTMTDVTKATEGLFKAAEEAAEFGRGNAEAVAKATQLYVAGVQDLGKQTMALFQGLSEQAIESAKAFSGVKSLKEAADLQASYTRATVEKTFAESAKLQETALKLAETSFAPLSARMTLAVEKFSKPLAA
jgi:phasin family protein